jgi:hypothetical protein
MTQFVKRHFLRSGIIEVFGFPNPFNGEAKYKELILGKNWLVNRMQIPYLSSKDWNSIPEEEENIFLSFDQEEIERLRKYPNTLYLFNYLWEGGDMIGDIGFFYKLLTFSGIKSQIPPQKIFFISSNLLEEEKYSKWQKENYPDYKINIVSFNFFSEQQRHFIDHGFNIDQTISHIKEDTSHFLSLNRRKKFGRNYTCYKIWKSKIYKNTLISYDKFLSEDLTAYEFQNESNELKEAFVKSSPSVLDDANFETNWAADGPGAYPFELFKNSLINLVSETLFHNEGKTSLFYSEKTFKPMIYNQPLIIFGQQNLNTSLEKVGFKTYKNYFNFDFENIENHCERIDAIISQLETIDDQLSSYTVSQKIDWLLQDRETLEYNKEALKSQDYNKMKLKVFIDKVNSVVG